MLCLKIALLPLAVWRGYRANTKHLAYWCIGLTLLLLFAPSWAYLLIVLPLNASAFTMVFEHLFYAPRERFARLQAKQIKHKLDALKDYDDLVRSYVTSQDS